jgi:hypothetical protein
MKITKALVLGKVKGMVDKNIRPTKKPIIGRDEGIPFLVNHPT